MKPIKILFFASLRERFKQGQVDLESTTALSVQEVWQRSSGEAVIPANILVSINQEYAGVETLVQPGDGLFFHL